MWAAIRQPILWLLIVAIMAYGQSATMVQLLGPTHRHDISARSPAVDLVEHVEDLFRGIRVWRAGLRERLLHDAQPHSHGDGVVHSHAHASDDPPSASATQSHPHLHPHVHEHGAYQRHHHDVNDASVIALDGQGSTTEATSAAAAGSAMLPFAVAPPWAIPIAAGTARDWPPSLPDTWSDATRQLADRPPRA